MARHLLRPALSAHLHKDVGQNAAPPVAWTPASPTTDGGVSAEHWCRSDDAYQDAARTTPVASDGDVVGNWTDLTANADHVSQATTGNKPTWQNGAGDLLNGNPVIRFDGIDDWLKGAFTVGGNMNQPNTIFVIAKLATAKVNAGAAWLFDGDDATHKQQFGQYNIPNPDAWAMYAGGAPVPSGGATDDSWHIWCFLFNGALSQAWKNGVSEIAGATSTHSMDGLTVGDREALGAPWADDVAEIVIYDADLSNADKNQLGNYAATRYGLSWTAI